MSYPNLLNELRLSRKLVTALVEPLDDDCVLTRQVLDTVQVDGDATAQRRQRRRLGPNLLREQLVDRYAVEVGEATQPRQGQRALTTLIGPKDRCFELLIRYSLDVLERQPALFTDRSQALPNLLVVRRHAPLLSEHAARVS